MAYIGAVLEKRNHEVRILDMPLLGLSSNNISEYILEFSPDVVGVTCVSINYNDCINIARKIKQIKSTIKLIVGGPHVSFISKKVLQNFPWVDIVVKGEGENTMAELLKSFNTNNKNLSSIKGISFRTKSGEIFENNERPLIKNIDNIPYPARHLLPIGKYMEITQYTSILASRGCNYNCIYCSASEFWKHKIRFRSPISICKEIKIIKTNYGIRYLKFIDDIFLTKGRRTNELLRLIKSLNIKWTCNTRIDLIDKRLIENAAKAGCEKIIFGIESLSPLVQKSIGKNLRINKKGIKKIIQICHDNGIFTKLNFIIGLPKQTKEDIRNILDLIADSKPREIAVNQLTKYIGTQIFNNFRNFDNSYYWNKKYKKFSFFDKSLNSKSVNTYIKLINKVAISLGIIAMKGY